MTSHTPLMWTYGGCKLLVVNSIPAVLFTPADHHHSCCSHHWQGLKVTSSDKTMGQRCMMGNQKKFTDEVVDLT